MTEIDTSYTNNFLNIFGLFCQQNSVPFHERNSTRIVVSFTIFFSFIFYQYYSTYIVASLITESPKSIKTLDDLLNSNLELGTTKAAYNRDLFMVDP